MLAPLAPYAAAWSSRSRARCTWWAPWRVHWPPVRVRCPVALSLSATFAHERPAAGAVLDDGCKGFLLALVPCPAPGDELEPVGRHPAGGAALLLEHLERR